MLKSRIEVFIFSSKAPYIFYVKRSSITYHDSNNFGIQSYAKCDEIFNKYIRCTQ